MKTFREYVMSEDNTSSSGAVAGMGFGGSSDTTGDGTDYIGGNVVDSDQRNNLLFKIIKKYHTDLHRGDKKKK